MNETRKNAIIINPGQGNIDSCGSRNQLWNILASREISFKTGCGQPRASFNSLVSANLSINNYF